MYRFHHKSEHTSQPRWSFGGCGNGDRNVATLDRPDNRRAEKGGLKDSIVLEAVGPEPSARQQRACCPSTTVTTADMKD